MQKQAGQRNFSVRPVDRLKKSVYLLCTWGLPHLSDAVISRRSLAWSRPRERGRAAASYLFPSRYPSSRLRSALAASTKGASCSILLSLIRDTGAETLSALFALPL